MTRIDQRFDQVDRRFDRVERRLDRLEERMDRGFEAIAADFRELSGQLMATNRHIAQIGWGVLAAVFVQMIVVLVAVS